MSDALLRLQNRVAGNLSHDRQSISHYFQPGRWLDVRERDAGCFSAVCGDYERSMPVAGGWHSDDVHYFDLSLSGRPASSWGAFSDAPDTRRRLGRVFFAPAGHGYRGEGGAVRQRSLFLFLRKPADFLENILPNDAAAALRRCLDLRCTRIETLLRRIAEEVAAPGFASELMLEGLGVTLLAETARVLRELAPSEATKGGLAPWRLKLIDERLRSASTPPTIAELATLCGISRRHLMRAFREESGTTLGTVVHDHMVMRAKALLAEGGQSIGTIAIESGFANASAFSTAFRRATSHSPSDFRAACRAGLLAVH